MRWAQILPTTGAPSSSMITGNFSFAVLINAAPIGRSSIKAISALDGALAMMRLLMRFCNSLVNSITSFIPSWCKRISIVENFNSISCSTAPYFVLNSGAERLHWKGSRCHNWNIKNKLPRSYRQVIDRKEIVSSIVVHRSTQDINGSFLIILATVLIHGYCAQSKTNVN